jgi:hypothetical protein
MVYHIYYVCMLGTCCNVTATLYTIVLMRTFRCIDLQNLNVLDSTVQSQDEVVRVLN